jgi:hypothetical protein
VGSSILRDIGEGVNLEKIGGYRRSCLFFPTQDDTIE